MKARPLNKRNVIEEYLNTQYHNIYRLKENKVLFRGKHHTAGNFIESCMSIESFRSNIRNNPHNWIKV
jgi:hypothetical protein